MRWLPLIGIVLFLVVGCGWRTWLQARRYGSSGFLLFQSGDWRQLLRDASGVVFVVSLVGQAVAVAIRPSSRLGTMLLTGSVILFGGIALLVAAQLGLGASWRVGIDEGARPGLVTGGFYRFSRNPIYLALFVVLTGYTMLIPTWLSLALLLGAFVGFRQQVLAEEAYLLRTYGDRYRDYARRVGRFLPGIGLMR